MTALHMTYQSVSSVAKAERIPARTWFAYVNISPPLYLRAWSKERQTFIFILILCIVVSVTDDAMKDKLEEMESIDYLYESL